MLRLRPSLPILIAFAVLGQPVRAAVRCPNLHFVIDRSGSMGIPLGMSTRWDVAKGACLRLLDAYDGKLPLGLTIFPTTDISCEAETPVSPALASKAAFRKALDARGPEGNTPTGAALRMAAMLPALHDPGRKQYMVLVTDGHPECDGNPGETVDDTVAALQAAYQQTPPIATFVVGFGGDLPPELQMALTRMAEAGGKPAPTPEKFYRADDAAGLNRALDAILTLVQDEFGGHVCDESCKTNGCPAGQLCRFLTGTCQPDPCAGVECAPGQFCYTDGWSPGACRRACTEPCPEGTRCSLGACVQDPCGNVCLPGTVCNAAAHRCELDPKCKDPQTAPRCAPPQECRGGECVDNPCQFIRCPEGTACVPWDGNCTVTDVPTEYHRGGCTTHPDGAAAGAAGSISLLMLLVPWAWRRRRGRPARR